MSRRCLCCCAKALRPCRSPLSARSTSADDERVLPDLLSSSPPAPLARPACPQPLDERRADQVAGGHALLVRPARGDGSPSFRHCAPPGLLRLGAPPSRGKLGVAQRELLRACSASAAPDRSTGAFQARAAGGALEDRGLQRRSGSHRVQGRLQALHGLEALGGHAVLPLLLLRERGSRCCETPRPPPPGSTSASSLLPQARRDQQVRGRLLRGWSSLLGDALRSASAPPVDPCRHLADLQREPLVGTRQSRAATRSAPPPPPAAPPRMPFRARCTLLGSARALR